MSLINSVTADHGLHLSTEAMLWRIVVSEQDPIRVFVTHLFQEDEDFQRVFEYLESRDNFYYHSSTSKNRARRVRSRSTSVELPFRSVYGIHCGTFHGAQR